MAGARAAADDSTPNGMPASIPELLRIRRAEADGEFLVTDDERLTFSEADTASRELADALLASGVGKGTRVGILFPNCAQWLISWLAAARIGALTVPLSTFAPGAELGRLLRHTDVQVVLMGQSIAGRDLVERMHDALPGLTDGGTEIAEPAAPYLRRIHIWPGSERAWASPWPRRTESAASLTSSAEDEVVPADDLVVVTTSGTTALPKSVVHTHGSLVRHAYHSGPSPRRHLRRPHLFADAVLLGGRTDHGGAAGAVHRGRDPRPRRVRSRCHAGAARAGTGNLHLLLGAGQSGHGRPSRLRQARPVQRPGRHHAAGVATGTSTQRTRADSQPARHDRDRRPAHHGRGPRHPAATRTPRFLRDPATRGRAAPDRRYRAASRRRRVRRARSRCAARSS